MAKLTDPMLFITVLLIARASVSRCQVQVLGRDLTCSNPSPFPFARPLSGANVRLSCNNGVTTIANGTTDARGFFNITVNPVPTSPPFFPLTCRVFIDLPANCSVLNFFLRRARVLQSVLIYPSLGQGSLSQFEARPFVA